MDPKDTPGAKPEPTPLDALADKVDQAAAVEIADQVVDAAPEEPQFPPELMAKLAKLPMSLLKAVRSRVAKKLPEILTEWPDDDLQPLADAIPPVVMKHLGRLAPMIEAYPEEGMLIVATLPLALGYFSATEKHQAAEAQKPAATPSAAVAKVVTAPPAASPAPADFVQGRAHETGA